jgi:metal-responsive CopG/Arc/MetJ family transcriptional regulator
MSTKTFNLSMSSELIDQIDKQAKLQGSNRSDFIRSAVRKQLTAVEQWQTASKLARSNYQGPQLTEGQVAELISQDRQS